MSPMGPLAWHDDAWSRVVEARQADRLPHALLLAGPSGVGKSQFAERLARALVCTAPGDDGDGCGRCHGCHLAASGSHPDHVRVAPDAPGKAIRIDTIRRLSAGSVLAADAGSHRVVIINPADAMNIPAQNALLKTLEEPVSRTLLLLVTARPGRLLATIRSRCQRLSFRAPEPAQVRDWLRGEGVTGDIDALLAVTSGAPLDIGRAREEGWVEAGRDLAEDLLALRQRQVNPLAVLQKWETRPLPVTIDALKRCLADLVRLGLGLDDGRLYHPASRSLLRSLAEGINLRDVFLLHDDVVEAERGLQSNLNPQMVLESLATRWLQATRPGGRSS
jgi:DNA polymerase III subunit delta'